MNRRDFVLSAACVSALGGLKPQRQSGQVSYVGSASSISVFRGCHLLQRHASAAPSFLALHPNGKLLFAANEVDEHLNLPTGSVESYSIHASSGQLTLINRQSLSLSATRPRHLAVSPTGRQLLVAAYGGGAYNVLPISDAGRVGTATQIFKQIGCGSDIVRQASSHPHSVLFHPSGNFVVGTDAGSDRIDIFRYQDGELIRLYRFVAPSGSGPGRMAIHPSGSLLFVLGDLDTVLRSYRFNAGNGHMEELRSIRASGASGLAIHPSGNFLLTSGGLLAAWSVDHQTGSLRRVDSLQLGVIGSPEVSNDGKTIYLLGESAFYQVPFDAINGRLGNPMKFANLEAPVSHATHSHV